MYRCEDCGRVFDTPHMTSEAMGEYWGSLAYEPIYICPHCSSEEIVPMHRCVCGEWIDTEDDYCEACIYAAEDVVTELAKRLKVKRTDAEDLLLHILE